jgi:hypothetical protein
MGKASKSETKTKTKKQESSSKEKPTKVSKSSTKASKSSKTDKPRKDKFEGIEKGDLPNKATAFAQLNFNVKTTQKWLSTHYSRYSIEKKKKEDDDDDEETKNKVKILNAHYALTATDQVICLSLVNLVANKATKGQAGLYTITESLLQDKLQLNKDFRHTFGAVLDSYSSHQNYASELQLSKDAVTKFIEKYAFNGGNTDIHLEDDGFNFLMFIMLRSRIMLATTAFQMAVYARKSSVDDRAILYSIRSVFVGDLKDSLFKKVENVSNRVRQIKNDGGDDDEDEAPKKSKKSGKASKKSKDESDSEEEASEKESDSDSGSGSDSDSD